MTPLNLFAIFHLNLAYSSIEEEQRATVVERCYGPLLQLAEKYRLPFGIEATAYTLEAAAQADPAWLDKLRELVAEGPCELVGGGYAQVIGPLVPAAVNAANLRIGNADYERLLGVKPRIALANEQAYSAGLVEHYLDAVYEALFMEWDNPSLYHDWDRSMRYLPQIAQDQKGRRIEVLWNKSTAFQKFQRYAHGDLELHEYLDYLHSHVAEEQRAFPLYGNDIEIFDFRPGRFEAEPDMEHREWDRIDALFAAIADDAAFEFVAPSAVREMRTLPGAANVLHLESPELSVPVKKQGKYNLTRWAVTGKDDLGINTRCWRLAQALVAKGASNAEWRELCYLWSSDFRTHITESRWTAYLERLAAFESAQGLGTTEGSRIEIAPPTTEAALPHGVSREGRYLTVTTPTLAVRLNTRRGLTIDSLSFASHGSEPLLGTLEHGFYDDINMTADYYTGHVVLERAGQHKVTDLGQVEPSVRALDDAIEVAGEVSTPLGPVRKRLLFSQTAEEVALEYDIDWSEIPVGSLRLGHVTLMPHSFERESLFIATNNGGALERFELAGHTVDHGTPVSMLVTASSCIGVTDGVVVLGDAQRSVRIEVDKTAAALVGLVTYREVSGDFFCRLTLSAFEADETRKPLEGQAALPGLVRLRISAS